jgi:hypothetical protein
LNPGAPLNHLSLPEVTAIIEKLRPRIAILTHFGMTMWRAEHWELVKKLSEETGITVLAARDGMKFDLDTAKLTSICLAGLVVPEKSDFRPNGSSREWPNLRGSLK